MEKQTSLFAIEEMRPDFIDTSIIQGQPQTLYRIDRSGHRYYYSLDINGQPTFYPSATTVISQTMPTSPHLIDWKASLGKEAADAYVEDRAHRGTFLHIQCGALLKEGRYDLEGMRALLEQYIQLHDLSRDFLKHEDGLKKDVLAFAQFCIEHSVQPVAIEIVLCHPKHGVAGAIDLVCYMNIQEQGYFGEKYQSGPNKGKRKKTKGWNRILAMVDLKSGKAFYDNHIVQLGIYRNMWNHNFPNLKVRRVFNLAPKQWRGTTPTFSLVEQTDKAPLKKVTHLMKLAAIQNEQVNNTVVISGGVIELSKGLENNIESKTLEEIVRRDDIINEKQ
jgi:hypothetical protein